MIFFQKIKQVEYMHNSANVLETIEIETSMPVQKSIIWMHGLGADGSDFASIVPEFDFPEGLGIRFIFPHAPVIPVTLNNGYHMRAWFDIHALEVGAKIDEERINQSRHNIEKLIEKEESRGISSEHIILAGFSQGSVIALNAGIQFHKPLGGVIALSGFLPLAQKVFANASSANTHLPIFIAHGTEDAILPYAFGKATAMELENAGYPVEWHSYAMGHTVCKQEIMDIRRWLIQK
jgi:phospholipase/carboxylesterase